MARKLEGEEAGFCMYRQRQDGHGLVGAHGHVPLRKWRRGFRVIRGNIQNLGGHLGPPLRSALSPALSQTERERIYGGFRSSMLGNEFNIVMDFATLTPPTWLDPRLRGDGIVNQSRETIRRWDELPNRIFSTTMI